MIPSPPSRRRGLKYHLLWISTHSVSVASLAEAWIEITSVKSEAYSPLSPPSRRRGLKYMVGRFIMMWLEVASLAEAWIEISMITYCS